MYPILLNESEVGKLCAEKVEDRVDLTVHLECYPDEDSDIFIEFTILWRQIEAASYFPGEALPYDKGRYQPDVSIYSVKGYRYGDEVLVIYSEEALVEQIESNLI